MAYGSCCVEVPLQAPVALKVDDCEVEGFRIYCGVKPLKN